MTPLDGTAVYIWNLIKCFGGDYDKIDQFLRSIGVRTIFLKAADGANWFPQNDSRGLVAVWQAVYQFQKRGYIVLCWNYVYGDDPKGEAQVALDTVLYRDPAGPPDYRGPDGLIFDVEDEYAGKAAQATSFLSAVRFSLPKGKYFLAYAPVPVVEQHLSDPYRQFDDQCDAVIPQCYDSMFKVGSGWALQQYLVGASKYGLNLPIFPTYSDAPGGFAFSTADTVTWLAGAKTAGCKGVSVWSLEHLIQLSTGPTNLQAATHAFPIPAPTPQPPPPGPVPNPCADLGEKLAALSDSVRASVTALSVALQEASK